MDKNKNVSLDEIIKDFKIEVPGEITGSHRGAITTWVDEDYKEKFDMLQERTKKKFGKAAKVVVMKLIDKACAEIG